MIVHGFQFFNELDLLHIKLRELWRVVDKFILVEAENTFTNKRKPFVYEENKEAFKDYESKIIHLKVRLPHAGNHWVRERYQREIILPTFDRMFSRDDVLIFSDMDEIVSEAAVERWRAGETDHKPTALAMDFYYFYVNNFCTSDHWGAPKIIKRSDITRDLTDIRYDGSLPEIKPGGWHFSFLGGAEKIKYKVQSYAHSELVGYTNDTNVENSLATGADLFHRPGMTFEFVPFGSRELPKYLVENKDKYPHFIKEV